MATHSFNVGDLLVSEQGTIAVVFRMTLIARGAVLFLMVTEKEDILDVLPHLILDTKLSEDIVSGRYKYYAVKQ